MDDYYLDRKKWSLFAILFPLLLFGSFSPIRADDGYRLWLRYDTIQNEELRESYLHQIRQLHYTGTSSIFEKAKEEIQRGLSGLLSQNVSFSDHPVSGATLIAGTPESSPYIQLLERQGELRPLGEEGYLIRTDKNDNIVIAANRDIELLYGTFHFLRLLQSQQSLSNLNVKSVPQIQLRVLNHWFNLDGTAARSGKDSFIIITAASTRSGGCKTPGNPWRAISMKNGMRM